MNDETRDREDPFGYAGSDLLGESLGNIFKLFGTMDPKAMMSGMMLQHMKRIHRELGELIEGAAASSAPSGMKYPDPWIILGIPPTATQDEVKKAWKRKSYDAHPDRGGSNEQQRLVNIAYELVCTLKGWSK
jgi:hypothetical protein